MNVDPYEAPIWLPGGDLQTLWAVVLPRPRVDYQRRRWELADGDFIDLDWQEGPADQPLVVLFHGLEGSSDSHYARHVMAAVRQRGWRGVVPHFRGCSGEPNRLARAYHSGDSAEIGMVLRRLASEAGGPLYALGFSLGGNALLRWLGEEGASCRRVIQAAAAVSAPLDLPLAGATLDRGFSRIYAARFLRTLRRKALDKVDRHALSCDREALDAVTTLRAFDDLYTAPLHGYRDAEDYWRRAASKPVLRHIQVPTLLINARNDPFMPGRGLPGPDAVSAKVRPEFPAAGGHVGFVTGPFPGGYAWLPERVLGFFAAASPPG
jgi:predicted alpha/beta-fold hydrolase